MIDDINWASIGERVETLITESRLKCLARNLAIGGALCEAHEIGAKDGIHFATIGRTKTSPWHPGCGKAAP